MNLRGKSESKATPAKDGALLGTGPIFSAGGRDGGALEVVGNARSKRVILRNVTQVIRCTDEEVLLKNGKEVVLLQGRSLFCDMYANRSLRVCGEIKRIEFKGVEE